MGGLAIATGGLIAPIVAHGVYDMLALAYIRRGAHNE
jgi:membrane protease YdiL (CAAX protease family)